MERQTIKKICKEIMNAPQLYFADPNKPYDLYTDASNDGFGSVLCQENKIIGYYSHKFNQSQKNYNVIEKELIAIILSLKFFRKLILGCDITVHTDNKNLTLTKDNYDSKVERWLTICNEYNARLVHINGSDNLAADYLSRLTKIEELEITSDSCIKEISENPTRDNLKKFHEITGHPGINAMYLTLKKYFPQMKKIYKIIKEIIKSCAKCQMNKTSKYGYGHISGRIITNEALEHVSSDIFGPFPLKNYNTTRREKKGYIVSFTDRCSRFSKLYFTTEITTESIIKGFEKVWVSKFGYPSTLLTDQGKCYISNDFLNYCSRNKIKSIRSSIYNPTGNSLSETLNKHINVILRIYKYMGLNKIIKLIELRNNYFINRKMNCSPADVLKVANPLNINNLRVPHKPVQNKNNNNKNRVNHAYKEGDKIIMKNMSPKKTTELWKGPYGILQVSKCRNRVLINHNKKQLWMNIKNIKPFLE